MRQRPTASLASLVLLASLLPILDAAAATAATAAHAMPGPAAPAALAGAPAPKTLVARARGDAPVAIDGRLDEPVWALAEAGAGFVERRPVRRGRPPVATEIRVLFDDDALYVGLTMELLPGERPRAVELGRDLEAILNDDAIEVKLDVRLDRRTTLGFAVNAAGAQLDYLALENGKDWRREHDAVWQSGVAWGPGAWTAELRLPVAALGLPPGEAERVIGLGVTRHHNARLATYDWTWMPPEFGARSALHYGELRGVRIARGGRPLALVPYVLAGYPAGGAPLVDLPAWLPLRLATGGDARLRIGEDAWAELTLLTDFAGVDLDEPVVKLDRFPLFLPEKRPFFLSGLDVFQFGTPGTAQLFFSRRIGLDEAGGEVPILGGLKIYGRSGPVGFGLLDVVTAPAGDTPAANWAVARLRRDVGPGAHAGAMIALREWLPVGLARGAEGTRAPFHMEPHWSAGVDGAARFAKNRLEVSGFGAATATEAATGDVEGTAAELSARWRGEKLTPSASLLFVSDDFRPEVGFVRRPGTLRAKLEVPWVEPVSVLGLEAVYLVGGGDLLVSDEADRFLGAQAFGGGGWAFRSGWEAELFAGWRTDVVEEPFEVLPGVVVPAGLYRGAALSARLSSPAGRNPRASLAYEGGEGAWFGGDAHVLAASGSVSLGRHLRLGADARLLFLEPPGVAPVTALVAAASITVNPTAALSADAALQLDTIGGAAVALARIRWRFLPGSDVFLVWREDLSLAEPASAGHSVALKASWRFDAML